MANGDALHRQSRLANSCGFVQVQDGEQRPICLASWRVPLPVIHPRHDSAVMVLRRWLARLSVGGKLLLGFGLVLACTLGMAVTAWHALKLTQASAAQLRALDRLQDSLASARQAEKDFGLAPSPVARERVDSSLQALRVELPKTGSGEEFLQAMADTTTHYLKSFEGYADARAAAQQAQLRMQVLAEATGQCFSGLFIDQLDDIGSALEQSAIPDALQLQLLEDAATLREKLGHLRDSELYFSLDAQKRYRDDWENRVNELGTALESLASRLDGERRNSLDQASQALDEYRQAFLRFVVSGESAVVAQTSMASSAERVTTLLDHERVRRTEADAVLRQHLDVQLAAMVLLALALSVGACLMIRRAIVTPLRQMLGLAQRVAGGDLGDRLEPSTRGDELGQLNDAIGVMLEALRALVGRIGTEVARLDQAAGSLAGTVERTGEGVHAQRQQAERVADAMQRMTRTAAEVNVQVDGSRVALGDASALIREGDSLVQQASDSLQRLSREMTTSAQSMQVLEAQSEAITTVLDVINAIAEQTNLLALNAAIEAARAGEHGRGFAVVADEVRALACRTRDSTGEIESMIQRLGQLTRKTADGLRDSHLLTAEGVDLTGRASGVLASITKAIVRLERTGQTIAEAAATQHEMARHVDQAVEQVGQVVEQNALDCGRLEEASGSLQRLSVSLGEAVGAFRGGSGSL